MSGSIARYVRRHHLGLIAVFIALGGGAYAATQPGPDGDIDACFSKKSGQLYVLKKKKCGNGKKAISWAQAGPRGPQGPSGPAGSPGTARAYARVGADGTLTAETANVSVTRPEVGTYCIDAGINPDTSPLIVTTDYAGAPVVMGTSTFDDGTDPVLPSGSAAPFATWRSVEQVCEANEYEVRTFEQRLNAGTNTFSTSQANSSFSFAIP